MDEELKVVGDATTFDLSDSDLYLCLRELMRRSDGDEDEGMDSLLPEVPGDCRLLPFLEALGAGIPKLPVIISKCSAQQKMAAQSKFRVLQRQINE